MFAFNAYSDSSDVDTAKKETKKEDVKDTSTMFDGIYIVSFVRRSNGFEYYFMDDINGTEYDPKSDGYEVRAVDYCKAKLVGLNDSKILTCRPDEVDAPPVRGGTDT